MSSAPNYAAIAKYGSASVTTGDASRTAPTLANTGQIVTAKQQQASSGGFPTKNGGARIDRVIATATGTSTVSMLRLWEVEGFPGKTITSMTFVGTTCTVTTVDPHGLATGDLLTSQDCEPRQYNVKSAAVTVLTPTTFTFPMATAPTVNASTVGQYSTTPAAPAFVLLKEIPVTAITPSSTVQAWNVALSESTNPEFMPLILPAGHQLRATVNDTQTGSSIMVSAFGGDM